VELAVVETVVFQDLLVNVEQPIRVVEAVELKQQELVNLELMAEVV
tara:strand:+ start:509 stop:646 length:138 start_codon:yes stop_codon:yes gene_type:complete